MFDDCYVQRMETVSKNSLSLWEKSGFTCFWLKFLLYPSYLNINGLWQPLPPPSTTSNGPFPTVTTPTSGDSLTCFQNKFVNTCTPFIFWVSTPFCYCFQRKNKSLFNVSSIQESDIVTRQRALENEIEPPRKKALKVYQISFQPFDHKIVVER